MHKWKDIGFWVSKQFYWQSLLYYFQDVIKFKSLTFFSACNPALSFGGMLADEKTEAYHLIDPKYLPKTIVYNPTEDVSVRLNEKGILFPVIVKPNMGFKGFAVRECNDLVSLKNYLGSLDQDRGWLIQNYIDLKAEYSIMYYRCPKKDNYGISSISSKTYPLVIGNGRSSLKQLIDQCENGFIDKEYLFKKWKLRLSDILEDNEKFALHNIGNYSRGSKFYSEMNEMGEALTEAIHDVFSGVKGIYFCRLDIKANSIDAVRDGDFKIIEINGAKGEPLHIYDPKYRFIDRWRDVKSHWQILTHIVEESQSIGVYTFPSNREGLKSLRSAKRMVR